MTTLQLANDNVTKKFWDLLLVAGPFFVLGLLFLSCWQQSKGWQSE
jgi:hypothetical protein